MLNTMATTTARLEKFRKNLSIVLKGQDNKMDLQSTDILVIPVLERGHFYLVCFDLRKPALEVIDNMHTRTSWVSMKDDARFAGKGVPYKIVS